MAIFILTFLALFITSLNVITVRTIKDRPTELLNSVDVLIPMRNESRNVASVLGSVLASKGCKNLSIYALDDNSEDDTGSLISNFKVNKIIGRKLPENWLGKNFACQQLAFSSSGEFLVFLDADVRLSENAIVSSIRKMESLGWDFISPYPRQKAGTLVENLIQPLLQWSWLASVPLRLSEYFPNRQMTIANGQFLIIRRSAYESIGGHESIKSEVLDDLELARGLVANGFKGGVSDGSKVASCRMYQSSTELISGYTKSLWKAFGGVIGSTIAFGLLIATGVIPLLALNSGYLLIVLSRALAALKTRSNPIYSLLHPLSIILLFYIFILSVIRHQRGTLEWRGRRVN